MTTDQVPEVRDEDGTLLTDDDLLEKYNPSHRDKSNGEWYVAWHRGALPHGVYDRLPRVMARRAEGGWPIGHRGPGQVYYDSEAEAMADLRVALTSPAPTT